MLGRVLAAVEGVGVLGVGARFVSAGGAVRNVATAEDKVEWERCVQMHATIGASNTPAPEKGGSVPPLYHWTAFQTHQAMENLGQDGHPKRGGAASDLSPDVPDTWRRMFGGSEIVYNRHPLVGEPLLRRAQIVDVIEKQGATPLKLCKIEYSYFGGNSATVRQRSAERGVDNAVFTETQTIVYIAPKEDAIAEDGVVDDNNNIAADAAASAALRHPPPPVVESPANTWIPEPACGALRSLSTNPTMLFRYSALTFNGHRIHYDLPYTMNVEGYPGLVVHGPLICTVLTHALDTPGFLPEYQASKKEVYGQKAGLPFLRKLSWRAIAPVFCPDTIALHGTVVDQNEETGSITVDLKAVKSDGTIAVKATAVVA